MANLQAPIVLFNTLMAREDELRNGGFSLETIDIKAAYDTAIDLWDGISKGVSGYTDTLDAYQRFADAVQSIINGDYATDAEKDAYREILGLIRSAAPAVTN